MKRFFVFGVLAVLLSACSSPSSTPEPAWWEPGGIFRETYEERLAEDNAAQQKAICKRDAEGRPQPFNDCE